MRPDQRCDSRRALAAHVAIAQHPAEIGYYGVVSAYAHLTGQSIPVAIGTGFTVLNADNIADPEVARYIYSE